ncbi:MAG: hypothetical protein IJ300_02855 [Clostridia bacterium]|nr:hypothetical protein [Clostridia bacterium]
MPKQGMKLPSRTHAQPKNDLPPVPEIQGKAKCGKEKANPLIEGIGTATGKVFHTKPTEISDKPIPSVYGAIDTDLGRDNLEIDLPKADIQNL